MEYVKSISFMLGFLTGVIYVGLAVLVGGRFS